MNLFRSTVFALVIATLAVAPRGASAQSDGRGTGLSAAIQDETTTVRVPIWMNEDFVLTPALAVVSVSDAGTDLGVGLQLRRNLASGDAVPYVGVGANALFLIPDEGDTLTDLLFNLVLGGESFLTGSFSVGVEAQLGLALSDANSSRFGNPDGTVVNTSTLVAATFYF